MMLTRCSSVEIRWGPASRPKEKDMGTLGNFFRSCAAGASIVEKKLRSNGREDKKKRWRWTSDGYRNFSYLDTDG